MAEPVIRTVAITQPTYLPWAGYFDLIARADLFILLDTVAFARRSWQSRNRILTRDGEVRWLSVPLRKSSRDTPIRDIRIAEQPTDWRRGQFRSIEQALGKAPCRADLECVLAPFRQARFERLAEMNEFFIRGMAEALGIATPIVRASRLAARGRRTDLLVALCRESGASRYYANAGSASYLELERDRFDRAGIEIRYQSWTHPRYEQRCGQPFVSHLSVIDAVAHLGLRRVGAWFAETDSACRAA